MTRNLTSALYLECRAVSKPDLGASTLSWLPPHGVDTAQYNTSVFSRINPRAPYGLGMEWVGVLEAGPAVEDCRQVSAMDGEYRCNASGLLSQTLTVDTQCKALTLSNQGTPYCVHVVNLTYTPR